MILENISKAMREQNYYAVVLEFLIVIAGVVIGFQITAWNADRTDLARSTVYLNRLRADLILDQGELTTRLDYWSDILENGHYALDYIEEGEMLEDSYWMTLASFIHASQVWRFTFNQTTYLELQSAGDLALIRDSRLRDELSRYHVSNLAIAEDGAYRMLPEYRRLIRGFIPSDIMQIYWDECHPNIGNQRILPCPGAVDENVASEILVYVAQSESLLPELRYWVDTLQQLIDYAESDIEEANLLIDLIDQ